jgi:hypothetical protein
MVDDPDDDVKFSESACLADSKEDDPKSPSVVESFSVAVSSFVNRISLSSMAQRANGYGDPNLGSEENEFEEASPTADEYCWTTLDRSDAGRSSRSSSREDLSSPEMFKTMLANVKKAEKEMDTFVIQKRKQKLQLQREREKFDKQAFQPVDKPFLAAIGGAQFSDIKHSLRRFLDIDPADKDEQKLMEEKPAIKSLFGGKGEEPAIKSLFGSLGRSSPGRSQPSEQPAAKPPGKSLFGSLVRSSSDPSEPAIKSLFTRA